MIKLACFDFSKTVAKDTGFGAGPAFLGRKKDYDKLYSKFKNGELNEESFVKSVVKLWKGLKETDLVKIHSQIELNPNIKLVLKQLHNIGIKTALISYIPTKLAELYKDLGFDFLSGTECETKNGVFTGNIIKMNSDKSLAIKKICRMNKMNAKSSIAIGDSVNDIKMFKTVGFSNSFAYNALEKVKKHAKHHISDFKEITKIIKQ